MHREDVERAFRLACRTELHALKPGNVHVYAAGSEMTVADFEASLEASAGPMATPGFSVGRRILESVRATRKAVGCNTNLGILLLAAPLAQAALVGDATEIRTGLGAVLDALDTEDAVSAYQAIRLAAPAGLGRSPVHDVAETPTVSLRQAMAEAAARDLVARQYANGYEQIFGEGLPTLRSAIERWRDPAWAAAATYLHFLASYRDSHVLRKFGAPIAEDLRRQAAPYHARLLAADDPADAFTELLAFDARLRRDGINPGTSADLCVASIFADALQAHRK